MVLKESNSRASGIGALCDGRRVPAVTIFGWDDVLCPTTYAKHERAKRTAAVFSGGGRPVVESKEHRKEFLKVGASVVRCVKAAQRHGPVVIVTEADEHWVRGSAELLLPAAAAAYLKNIEIVSSKERFGKEFPGQPTCWQIAAFSYVTNRHLFGPRAGAQHTGSGARDAGESRGDGDRRRECDIVKSAAASGSSGSGTRMTEGKGVERAETTADSETEEEERRGGEDVEIAAAGGAAGTDTGTLVAVSSAWRAREDKSAMRTLRDHHPNIVAKTVALIQGPTPSELRKQLDLMSESFAWMFGHPRRESSPSSHSPAFTSTKPATATSLETTTMTTTTTTSSAPTTAATKKADGASTTRTSTSPTSTFSTSMTGMPVGVQPPYLADLGHTQSNVSLIRPRKVIDRCDTGGNESDTKTNTTDTNTTDSRSAEDGEFLTWGESGGGGGGFCSPGAPPFSTLSAAGGSSEIRGRHQDARSEAGIDVDE